MSALDIDAYFARIGHQGRRDASLATLVALHALHPQAIAFENLDPFLGRPVELDLGAVEEKLVGSSRGGYCFEHNKLFAEVLKVFGFAVTKLAARVLWGHPDDRIGARSHMALAVEIEGKTWLADVGFGGLTQTAPLLIADSLEQETPHETFRIVDTDGYWKVQARVGGEWRSLYRFDLERQYDVDYAVTSYFAATHPSSHFVTSLIAARPLADRRYALRNNRLSIHHKDGRSEQRQLDSAAEIARTLEEVFGIEIPDAAAFEAAVRDKQILEA